MARVSREASMSEPLGPEALVAMAMKRCRPSDGALDSAWASVLASVSEPRVQTLSQMSQGTWNAELSRIEVTQMRGKYWEVMGHPLGPTQTTHLYPEEALILVESQQLHLQHGGVALSIQKAVALLAPSAEAGLKYRAYASLVRLGYKVVRHAPAPLTLKRPLAPNGLEAGPRAKRACQPLVEPQPDGAETQPDPGVGSTAPASLGSEPDHPDPNVHALSLPNGHYQNRLTLTFDRPDLLPLGARPSRRVYEVELGGTRVEVERAGVTFSLPQTPRNWRELLGRVRTGVDSQAAQNPMPPCPWETGGGFYPRHALLPTEPSETVRSPDTPPEVRVEQAHRDASPGPRPHPCLWSGRIKPMIEPKPHQTMTELLRAIRIPDLPSISVHARSDSLRASPWGLRIDFDVYLPHETYKKSKPQLPSYRLAVTSSNGLVPSGSELHELNRPFPDQVPLLIAVVGPSSISFFGLHRVALTCDAARR